MGRRDKMNVFRVLITAMRVVCASVVTLCQELEQPTVPEGVFGLAHL
jgi:hypothetical protein